MGPAPGAQIILAGRTKYRAYNAAWDGRNGNIGPYIKCGLVKLGLTGLQDCGGDWR